MSYLSALLTGTCTDLLASSSDSAAQLFAVRGGMRPTIIASGSIYLAMTMSIPIIYLTQYRRGLFWFFRLRREARGLYIVSHPFNVFLLFQMIAAICVFTLAITVVISDRDHTDRLRHVTTLLLTSWIANALSLLYITLGTLMAIPTTSRRRAPRFINHPYVINFLVVVFPFILACGCIPSVVFARRSSSIAIVSYARALHQLTALALQDPAALIPADVQLLLLQAGQASQQMRHHYIPFFSIMFALGSLLTPLEAFVFHRIILTLRRQTLEQAKRVESLGSTQRTESEEKALQRKSSGDLHQSRDIEVDGLHVVQRLDFLSGPSSQCTSTSSPISLMKPLPSPTPGDQTTKGPFAAVASPLSQGPGPLNIVPSKAMVPNSTISEQARQVFVRDSTTSQASPAKETPAAMQRLAFLKRCYRTMAAFYMTVVILSMMHLAVAIFTICAVSFPTLHLDHFIEKTFVLYDCAGACVTAMSFGLIGIKLSDTGIFGD